jgi:hypothetical protein
LRVSRKTSVDAHTRRSAAIPAACFASQGEIMKLCGWKTRTMFDRYDIIDHADLTRAVARRFSTVQSDNGKATATNRWKVPRPDS